MRILGKLDLLQELTEEEKLSPNEYYAMVNSVKKHQRKRARSSKKKEDLLACAKTNNIKHPTEIIDRDGPSYSIKATEKWMKESSYTASLSRNAT